jgi:AraC family transcriptional regulator
MGSEFDIEKVPGGGPIDLEIVKRKSWPGVTACFARVAGPVTFRYGLKSNFSYVVLCDLYRVDGEMTVSGAPRSIAKDLRGKLLFIPAGCPVEGWAKIESSASFIILMLDSKASSRPPMDLTQFAPRVEFEDQTLRLLMLRFQALLDDRFLDVPEYAETLAQLLTFELARVAGSAAAKPIKIKSSPSGLAATQLRLITEYIDRHLNEKIAIADLAALVDLTRFHFIRAFTQAAGMTPLQFVIRRRIERAREFLADPSASISDVAIRSGFGSPVQMTRAFRRIVGTTPSAIRRGD